jgi:Ras family protein
MKKQRKIVVMGSPAVGKSAITIQFCEGHFADMYSPTIENTFQADISVRGQSFEVRVLDTAGQDEYSLLHAEYSVGVHGHVLVYSVASRASFEYLTVLNDKLLNSAGVETLPRVVVGNKIDMDGQRQVSVEEGRALAATWGCGFVECSAKLNENVKAVFTRLVEEIERNAAPPPRKKDCAIL